MKHMHVLFAVCSHRMARSGSTSLLAQESPSRPSLRRSEETTRTLVSPTPQLLQVEVDMGAGGLGLRLRYTPPGWPCTGLRACRSGTNGTPD